MNLEIKNKLGEFRSKLPIDRLSLEVECSHQAALYDEVGEFVAELRKEAKLAKDNLEFVRARLSKEATINPGLFGISKVTVDAVVNAVLVTEEYRNALSVQTETQYLAELGNNLMDALEQRKSMIKDTVTLLVHQYYSTKQDMSPERRSVQKVSEDEVMAQRRELARRRAEENKQEEVSND